MCHCAFTFLSSLLDRQSPVFENASQNTLWYMCVGMLCVVFVPASGNKRTNKGSGYLSVSLSLSIKYSPMYIFCFVLFRSNDSINLFFVGSKSALIDLVLFL